MSRGDRNGSLARRLPVAAIATLALAVSPAASAPAAGLVPVHSFSITGTGGAQILRPTDVAVDNSSGPSAHDVYVADAAHSRVVKFDPAGRFLSTFGEGV